ncbi:MAG: GAF domain-containing protein [Anaerolineae bacterium]|nr:MAG: GAF domain-containing protein [Anaerolineae bacterium]
MGVLTEASSHPSKKEASAFRVRTLLDVLTLAAMGAAFVLLVAYLIIALDWQRQPFLGAMFTHSLTVADVKPFSNQEWPALEAGLQHGDTLLGINGQEWDSDRRAKGLKNTIKSLKKDESVTLSISHAGDDTPADWQCEDPIDGRAFCTVSNVKLSQIPAIDFLVHFGFGYLVGVVVFLIAGVALWQRFDSLSTKAVAVSAAALALLMAGRFDLMTTFTLMPAWIVSAFVFSSLLLLLALVFPANLPFMYRAPQTIRYAPLVLGAVLIAGTLWLHFNSVSDNVLLIPLVAILISAGTLMVSMFWRRIYSTSPVIHEQASFISLGILVALGPFLLWVIYFLITGGGILNELTPVVQVTSLIFVLSIVYAVLQYRLLQTDRIIPEFIVYSVLTALLVVGYLLVTIALGIGAVEVLNADSPILIALTIGVIVALFGPARNMLRHSIDEVMFRQRRSYQQRSEAFNRKLTNAVNLSEIYAAVKTELDEVLSPLEVFLFVFDTKTGTYIAAADPETGKVGTDISFRSDGGLIKYLSEEQSTLYLEPGQPLPITAASDRSQLAVLAMPLFVRLQGRDRVNGILCLGIRRNGDPYSYEDLRFVESVADLTAVAVDRAKFVDDLQHRVRIQDVLSQVSHALNYAIDFDTLLELIFAQTLRIINADHFYIVLRDPATDDLYYSFYSTRDERFYHIENKRWKIGRDVISEVARRQAAMRLENFTAEQLKRDPRHAANLPDVYAWIGVPLISDTGGALGVMGLGASDPGVTFTDEQMQLFTDIANIAASAIDKTQLFKKTNIRAAQLKALNDISGLLASELEDVDRLLEIITESAVSILGCEAGSLLLVDEKSGDLIFRVATGGKGSDLIGQRISRDERSLVSEAVSKVQPIIVNNPTQDSRWHGDLIDTDLGDEQVFRSKALLTVPLVAQGDAVGALQVINKRDGSPFTEEDAELANTFAGQAAVAIQNARLFELQDQQLLMRVQELEGMAAIDHSLNQTLLLDQLTDIIMGWALERTGATHGAIFLMDKETERLVLIASYGYPEEGSIFSLPEGKFKELQEGEVGILGRVVTTGTPAMITDVSHDPNYVESLSGCTAQIAVPLVSGAEITGALLIESAEEGRLGLLEFNFLSRLADRASAAISNALLYSQLSEQQKARVDFVRFIAHELNTPITAMKGYMGLILRGISGELNPQQQNFLQTVNNNIETLEHLVSDMREVEMLAAGQTLSYKPESIDFNEVLAEVLSTVQQGFADKEQVVIRAVPDHLPEIWIDRVRLKQILSNFLTNANKYTPEEGEVVVSAEAVRNEWDPDGARRVLHVAVKDNGLGISQEDQKKLFQKYFRSTNPKAFKDQKGTGLGLTLTRSLIEQQGGKVWVESDLGKGSTFHFTIPLASEVLTERA